MAQRKKFATVLAGLAVIVAVGALPAFASANELTDAGGAVPTGSEIRATSTNVVTKTAIGEFDCDHVEVGGEVTTNSDGAVTVGMLTGSEEIAEGCVRRTPLGEEVMTLTMQFQHLHLETGGTNTTSFTYVQHFPALKLTCHFQGIVSASVAGGGTAIQTEGVIAGTSPEPCPKGGNFSGTFSLVNASGAVTID